MYNWPKVLFSSQFTKVRTFTHLSTFPGENGQSFECGTVVLYLTLNVSLLKQSPQKMFSRQGQNPAAAFIVYIHFLVELAVYLFSSRFFPLI